MKTIILSAFLITTSVVFGQSLEPLYLEQLINTDVPTDQHETAITSDENDNYIIVWTAGAWNGGNVIARKFGSDHVATSNEITIKGSAASDIRVEYKGNGTYIISYIESGGDLKFVTLDDQNTLGTEVTVASSIDQYDFDVKGDSLAWLYRYDGGDDQLYLRGYNMNTNGWINTEVLATEDLSNRYSQPNVVYHPDGRMTIIYHYYINTSGCCDFDRRVMRKSFNANYLAEIPEYSIWTVDSEQNVGNDLHAEGNVNSEVIVTTTHGTTASQRFMRLWMLDASGNLIVNNDILHSGGDWFGKIEGQLYDNGDFVITKGIRIGGWNDPNDSEAYVIYGKNFNESNSGLLLMNSTSSGPQEFCSVTKLSDGNFVAAWSGNGFQGDTQGVYSRAYSAVAFPGVGFETTGNYEVAETGTSVSISLKLNTQPSQDVVVELTNPNMSEISLSQTSFTFTNSNWDQTQNLVVTGLDDVVDDGNIQVNVSVTTMNSTDTEYSSLADATLGITNLDDDATLTMPGTQTFCKSLGMSGVNALITNNGYAIQSVTASSSDQAVVDNSDITVNDLGAGSYEVVIANLDNNTTGTATITLTANDGTFNYLGDFDVTTTGVNFSVNATATEICEGDEVTLTASGAQNISWDNNVTNGVAFSPSSTMTYTVSGDDGGGCQGSEQVTITVNAAPATPTITLFGGQLISSATTGNQWYFNGTLIPTETGQTIDPVEDGTYMVEVTENGCSSQSDTYNYSDNYSELGVDFETTGNYEVAETGTSVSISLKLNTQPSQDVVVELTNPNMSEISLSQTSFTFTNSNWDQTQNLVVTGLDDVVDDGNIQVNVSVTTMNSTDTEYSSLADATLGITNLDDDATLTMPGTQTFCKSLGMSGVNALITNNGYAIQSVTASSSDQAVVDNSDITVNDLGAGSYEVVIANLDNNTTGTATITLTANDGTFNYLGDFDVTTTGVNFSVNATATEICEGDEVTLTASGAQNISWDNNVTNGVAFSPSSTMTYTVSGDDGGGCQGSEQVTITVNAAPATPTITLFGGQLISSATTGNQWYFNGTLIPTETGQTIDPVEDGTYMVEVTENGCSSQSDTYNYSESGVGFDELTNETSIYPNPANSLIYFNNVEANSNIQIFDITGSLVIATNIDQVKTSGLDVSRLNRGTYFIEVRSNYRKSIVKMIKK